jgi:transposase InsO family protein
MNRIHPVALFRLSVLGQLASRERLERGDLKQIIKALAQQRYDIPGSNRCYLTEKTIEHWYYAWKREGIEGLSPKKRVDAGETKLDLQHQEAIVRCKTENKRRSLTTIKRILEKSGLAALGELSRSSIYRFLKNMGLSERTENEPVERRSFLAEQAADIWYGDVLHGPSIWTGKFFRKVYLVSLMDDASRLVAHSEFCLGETALDIEGVLKQALLKRGIPKKIVIDNGAAYRSASLQGICARLGIRLVYCKPYRPEGKGKIERWHKECRNSFLNELELRYVNGLHDLNARLWAWIENEYHQRACNTLGDLTPIQRWQKDILNIQPLGSFAHTLDALFYHRHKRKVRRDATVMYNGHYFEVSYELTGKTVMLVVDPHQKRAIQVESEAGLFLGPVTPLDAIANLKRRRAQRKQQSPVNEFPHSFNLVELSLNHYQKDLKIGAQHE